ncbi:hypothetical protein JOB18_034983 [Solea senegalensis]|uniref:Uncharacterized protein n=1 Tax=Solea senegalensis TaxID=28829 RepID=A0AAV6SM07_SOLSE|nr:hypothetical protein JOB18_034983 [Solea senegalensis]
MSGRLKLRRLGGQYSWLLVGASCRLSNRVEPTEPFQVNMPCGSIKGTQPMFPPAGPQVVQTRKHSLEVRIAEHRTPDKFPLIPGLAKLTAVSLLQGQDGHSSPRVKLPAVCPQTVPNFDQPFKLAVEARKLELELF